MKEFNQRLPIVPFCSAVCIVMILAIGYADSVTPPELTLDILYLVPIAIAAWYAGKWPGIAVSVVAGGAWCAAQHVSGYRELFPTVFWWNLMMLQVVFVTASLLISKLKGYQMKISAQKAELELAFANLQHSSAKLHVLNQRKDDFLAVCSHDIRSPLCGNIAGVQILLKLVHGPLTAGQRDILERNMKINREIITLTGDLLDLARIESGSEGLNIESFNLAEVLLESVDTYGGWDEVRPVNFEIHPIEGVFEINADRLKVQRIFNNLISNAVKYSPNNGVVKIVVNRFAYKIEVAISDSGPGIPREQLSRLFDRFSSLALYKKTRDEGTGLGLSIACGLIKLHGGEISVASEVGEGTTFFVSLPLEVKAADTKAPHYSLIRPADSKMGNVLSAPVRN